MTFEPQYHSFEEALSILRQITLAIGIAEEVGHQISALVLFVLHSFHCFSLSDCPEPPPLLPSWLQTVQFEHRDMHRGNVLVRRTKEEFIYFRMDHKDYYIKSYGVRATIVDYTLSRVTQKGRPGSR